MYRTFRSDLAFWRRLAIAAGGPVLELGSGTGRVAEDLARHGFQVTGLDSDPGMLAWAGQHRPPLPEGDLAYLQLDITEFSVPGEFGLVVCPCNTLSLLSSKQAQRVLVNSRLHLRSAGVFAAELAHPRDVRLEATDPSVPLTAFEDLVTGWPVQVFARQRFDARRQAAELEWILDELQPDGRVQRHSLQQVVRLWEPEAVQQSLRKAGFAGSCLLGGYQAENYDEQSQRMLVVAVAP
jgi:SAM-dependent methyltransferase